MSPLLLFILGTRASTSRTASVAIAALRRVVGWSVARTKLPRRQSGRDETVTSPDVQIGETSTDANSASVDVSQSVETRLSRSGMAPRFSNVVIRGSLAASGEMALYQIAPRISGWPGEATASHYKLFGRAREPQIPDKQHHDI